MSTRQQSRKQPGLFILFILSVVLVALSGCSSADTSYTVAFEANGGTAVAAVITTSIDVMPLSAKAGWTLDGWYVSADLTGESVIFPFSVDKDLTLYAKWHQGSAGTSYTVTFDVAGGNSVLAITNTVLETCPNTWKNNYTFQGWYLSSGFSGSAVTFPYTVSSNQTLYAKWQRTHFTVTVLASFYNSPSGYCYVYLSESATKDIILQYDNALNSSGCYSFVFHDILINSLVIEVYLYDKNSRYIGFYTTPVPAVPEQGDLTLTISDDGACSWQ
jgi:uncharacterized repeat protein (TIGR02543 family)